MEDKTHTTEQIAAWKEKADKWDALEKEISKFYFDEEGNELSDTDDDLDGGLLGIGEAAALAFGFM